MFLGCGEGYVSYARFTAREKLIIIISGGTEERDVTIPVYLAEVPMNGILNQVFMTNSSGYSIFPTEYKVKDGMLSLHLNVDEGLILEAR